MKKSFKLTFESLPMTDKYGKLFPMTSPPLMTDKYGFKNYNFSQSTRVKGLFRNFCTPHSLSPPNRVVGFVCRHVEGVDQKIAKVRSFSTNGGGDTPINKLVINSTPEQVVFENDKAVLMLPSLKPFLWLIEHYTKEQKTTHDLEKYGYKFKDFFFSLLDVLHGLECGYYKFD